MRVQEDFFDKIDSEVKAYLLGFLLADGCIRQPKGNRQLNVTLSIQEEDRSVNELLIKYIVPYKESKIYHSPSKKAKGEKPLSILTIVSEKLCIRLINLGCNINKSKVGIKFPTYRGILLRHFIRGYYDGNGGISIRNRAYKYLRKSTYNLSKLPKMLTLRYSIFFCSTDLLFLNTLKEVLSKVRGYITSKQTKNLITYTLNYDTVEDVKEILNFMYFKSNYYLDRKYKKFEMLIKSQAVDTFTEGLTTT